MDGLTHEGRNYLKRKLSHLLFEMLEYPQKKEMLYLGICYCQLARRHPLFVVPLEELRKCLSRYLIDFDRYPWRDYLLEWEFFLLQEGEDFQIRGKEIINYKPNEGCSVRIDIHYKGILDVNICERIFRYWFLTKKWDRFLPPSKGWEVIKNAVILLNEGLYSETLFYLEDYLPLIKETDELLMYRVLRSLSTIGELVELRRGEEALKEIAVLGDFLKDFKSDLKRTPYNFKKLRKNLSKLGANLYRNNFLVGNLLYLEEKKGKSLGERVKKFLKWLPIFR